MNRLFRIILSLGLLVILFFVVKQAIKIEDLRSVLYNFPKEQLILFIGLSIAISFTRSFRFLLLLHNNKIPISLWKTSRLYFASQMVTPLPGGEMFRGFLVSQHTNASVTKTTGPIITQAYLEISSAILLVFIGSIFIEDDFIWPAFILFCALGISSFILIHQKTFDKLIKRFPHNKIFELLRERLLITQKGIRVNVADPHHGILKTFIVSICIHLLGGLLVLLIAQAYAVNISYPMALFAYTTGIIIQGIAAIVPAGIGITEGGMSAVLLVAGVDLGRTFAIVLMFRIITLFFSIMIGLTFFMLFYAKKILINPNT